jgi:hypothetical protein
MRAAFSTLAAGFIVIAPMASGAQEPASPAPLVPASSWKVENDGADKCMLTRDYGPSEKPVSIAFRPALDHGRTEIIVLTPTADSTAARRSGNATITVGPAGQSARSIYSSVKIPNKPQRLIRFSVDGRFVDMLPSATRLTIDAGDSMMFDIQGADKAVFDLQQCEAKLLASWGVDPAAFPKAATPPTGNPAQWFRQDAYPKGPGGRVVAVLTLGSDGAVTDCRVVVNVAPDLDRLTCDIARAKVRYSPALDEAGKPVPSWAMLPVRWAGKP